MASGADSPATNSPARRADAEHVRVAVVGGGSLGSEVVRLMGLLRVGEVIVIDPDITGPESASRSVLFRIAGGENINKAEALVCVGQRFFARTRFRAYPIPIADVGLGELRGLDLIFCCVDNDMARIECAWAAIKLGVPVCDGGIDNFEGNAMGRVTWFGDPRDVCYCCLLRPARRAELLATADSTSLPCWADPNPLQFSPGTCTLAAITAGVQAETGFRRYFANCRAAETLGIRFHPSALLEVLRHARSTGCPFHSDAQQHFVSLAPGRKFLDLLEEEGAVVELDWPVCIRAICSDCDHAFAPHMRVGLLRQHGLCPSCGGGRIDVLETVGEISRDSPYAPLLPRQLGLPDHHIYKVNLDKVQPGRVSL